MMMMMMKSTLFATVFVTIALSATIQAAPADLKVNDLDTNEIPLNKKLHKKGVSANWGGYQASAGLGGESNGGGLFASAGTANNAGPSASAGLFGGDSDSKVGASANVPEFYGHQAGSANGGGQFFDRVFSIPINVLHSVNDYLKTKGNGVHAVNGGSATSVRFNPTEESNSQGGAAASASAPSFGSAEVSSGSSAGTVQAAHHGHQKPDYDKIFNIPITALKSVNDFLGGR